MQSVWSTEHRPERPSSPLVVVLVHGTMDRAASFAKTARRLDDLHVVRYDRRGYGHSLAMGPARDVAQQVDDLLGVIDGRPSVVAGHSLGGVIALAAAARHPDVVRAVVAYESPRSWLDWWPPGTAGGAAISIAGEAGPEEAAERFMRRMVGDERWERMPPSTRQARRAEGPAMVAEIDGTRRPPAPYEDGDVTVPVVVGHGTESQAHHQRTAQDLAAALPRAELHVVDGSSHGVHLTHPGEFAALVRRAVALAGVP
jgi:pimeloyl-ACP methyl ester carboxylesterase